ncbi:putative NHN endonuclease [Exiguobacterium phage vB_EauM-23]|nr:putative NHN endonuclease [Exiguobacterium phage vB_EauM-23]
MTPKTIHLDGMAFTQSGRAYYYNSANRIYLHRYIWETTYGAIPLGFEVHHIDGNPANNELENLTLMTTSEHRDHHARELSEERRQWMRDNLNNKARPKAVEWHKSEEGRAWHKEHYEQMKDSLHRTGSFVCDCCGKSYEAPDNGLSRFCSNKCKSKWRRDQGLDNETRTCQQCGNEFVVNKYSKSRTCSRSCSNRLRYSEKQGKR